MSADAIKFILDERHPIFTTASPHQPTSLHVLVCAPPAVDVTNGSARYSWVGIGFFVGFSKVGISFGFSKYRDIGFGFRFFRTNLQLLIE